MREGFRKTRSAALKTCSACSCTTLYIALPRSFLPCISSFFISPIKILVFFLTLTLSSMTRADILGVSDIALLTKSIEQLSQLRHQYELLKDTYDTSKNQLASMNQLKNMHSGHYGYGDLSNGLDTLQTWQSPASTWDEALRNLSGGNSERYASLLRAYEENHPALKEETASKYMNAHQLSRFKEDKAVNRAVQVETTAAYNEINKHMAALQKLSKAIEKTKNTKGAIDLNSRLVTELGFIQLMQLRLQTLVAQQVSQDSLSELSERAEAAKFNRMKP